MHTFLFCLLASNLVYKRQCHHSEYWTGHGLPHGLGFQKILASFFSYAVYTE